MLTERRPNPKEYQLGDKDPRYLAAVHVYTQRMGHRKTHPDEWGFHDPIPSMSEMIRSIFAHTLAQAPKAGKDLAL